MTLTRYYRPPAPLSYGSAAAQDRDPFRMHTSAVATLGAADILPPEQWSALLRRYQQFVGLGDRAVDRLAEEVINPAGAADLAQLRAAALLDELDTADAAQRVTARVSAAVLQRLQALYKPAAPGNYRSAAERYNTAARRFCGCADVIDVESDGSTLVHASQSQREAWIQAEGAATRLEETLKTLLAAAALCGGMAGDVGFLSPAADISTVEYQVAVATDPGKAHRRKVFAAWAHTGGRCGRWSALHSLGVRLRAASDPVRVDPYRRPDPYVTLVDAGNKVRQWDPHDGRPPAGWRAVLDGWENAETAWSAAE